MYTAALAMLSFEHYITLGGILAPSATALSVVWLTWFLNRIGKKVDAVQGSADTAAAQTVPTGNGFAAEVRTALAEIKATQRAHTRDLGGIRGDLRQTNERVGRLEDLTLAPRKD